MKKPITFDLLNKTWKVRLVDRYDASLSGISEAKVTGTTNFCTKEIFIATGLTEEMTKATITHEVTHAVIKQFMDGKDEFDQEEVAFFLDTYGSFIVETSEKIYQEMEEGKNND